MPSKLRPPYFSCSKNLPTFTFAPIRLQLLLDAKRPRLVSGRHHLALQRLRRRFVLQTKYTCGNPPCSVAYISPSPFHITLAPMQNDALLKIFSHATYFTPLITGFGPPKPPLMAVAEIQEPTCFHKSSLKNTCSALEPSGLITSTIPTAMPISSAT